MEKCGHDTTLSVRHEREKIMNRSDECSWIQWEGVPDYPTARDFILEKLVDHGINPNRVYSITKEDDAHDTFKVTHHWSGANHVSVIKLKAETVSSVEKAAEVEGEEASAFPQNYKTNVACPRCKHTIPIKLTYHFPELTTPLSVETSSGSGNFLPNAGKKEVRITFDEIEHKCLPGYVEYPVGTLIEADYASSITDSEVYLKRGAFIRNADNSWKYLNSSTALGEQFVKVISVLKREDI